MVSHVILFQLIQKYRIGFPMTIAHAGGENVFSPLIARLPLTDMLQMYHAIHVR